MESFKIAPIFHFKICITMKKLLLCSLMFCIAFTAFGQDKQERKKRKKAAKIEQVTPNLEAPAVRTAIPVAVPENAEDVAREDVAVITFTEQVYEYGTIQSGDVVEHVFKFTNTGKVPLVIESTKSTCGCTVPQYPREPIPPGESGEIAVKFNSKNKSGRQRKPVNITANTWPKLTVVYIDGTVEKAEK